MAKIYMEKSVLFAVSTALASVISLSCCSVCVCVCVFTLKYWLGQKVHSCFSRTSYRKTRMNFGPTQYLTEIILPFSRDTCCQFSSVTQSCPTLCDPVDCRTPSFPVHHQLPELTQTHAHQVSDAIQPSHPLSSPSPPAPKPSQHQSLFQ